MTQTKLAYLAGLTTATICRYELGRRLRQSNLKKLEQALADYTATQKIAAALYTQREEEAFEREIERLEQRAEAFREFKQRIAAMGISRCRF